MLNIRNNIYHFNFKKNVICLNKYILRINNKFTKIYILIFNN